MGGPKWLWVLIMIELTDEAISAAIKKTNDYGRDAIRLGVSSGGCAGYEYIIEFADTIAEDDHILDYGKFTIVINPVSIPFLEGSTLDYIHEGINESFKIINPQETAACGCGVCISF